MMNKYFTQLEIDAIVDAMSFALGEDQETLPYMDFQDLIRKVENLGPLSEETNPGDER